jgi:hypothetical protein
MASNSPQVAGYASAVRGSAGRKPAPLWMKLVIAALVCVGLVGGSIGFVNIFGRVSGEELCAETLERRTFYYLEIPLIHYQIQPTLHIDTSGSLQQHLTANNLVPSPPAAKKTWHVITITRGVTGTRKGDPEILIRYLDARDSEFQIAWLKWTEANPTLAAPIWKGVCDLALANQYTTIPDLMELSQGATDPVALQTAVQALVKAATKPAAKPATPAAAAATK